MSNHNKNKSKNKNRNKNKNKNKKNADEKKLDEYLYGRSSLSKLYRSTDAKKPGLELDNSIVSAARCEVASKGLPDVKKFSPFSNNYLIPFATAASIIIVITMVSFFPDEQIIEFEPESVTTPLKNKGLAEQPVILEQESIPDSIPETKEKRKTTKLAPEQSTTTSSLSSGVSIKDNTKLKDKKILAKRVKVKKENSANLSNALNTTSSKQRKVISSKKLTAKPKAPGRVDAKITAPRVQAVDELTTQSDSLAASALLFNSDLVYNEFRWEDLSANEWRRRIIEIYHQRGEENDIKEIIVLYNKKFPKMKLTVEDIIKKFNK